MVQNLKGEEIKDKTFEQTILTIFKDQRTIRGKRKIVTTYYIRRQVANYHDWISYGKIMEKLMELENRGRIKRVKKGPINPNKWVYYKDKS